METRLDIVFTLKGPLEQSGQYCLTNTIVHTTTYKEVVFQDNHLTNLASYSKCPHVWSQKWGRIGEKNDRRRFENFLGDL